MASPIDLANRQQVYLERLKAGQVSNWNRVHGELRRRVRTVLAALEVSDLQDLTRKELEKALFGLRSAMMEVTAPAMDAFASELPGLADYAANLEITGLRSLVANPPRFNAPTAKLAYQAALESPVQASGEMVLQMVKGWPVTDAERVSKLVRKGWAQNMSLMDMIREACGTKANNYEDGFLDVSRRHAGTVINTSMQHVANAARMDVWERNGDLIERYQWLSTLDRRTTVQCQALDGRTFEAGKGPMPPLHPNCRSTTVAVLPPEFDFLDKGATRASGGPKPGYVDADQTYYDWLKTQPADFQDVALGAKRAKLFRDGGLPADKFAELNLGRNFEPLTLEEMRKIEPEAFKRAGL